MNTESVLQTRISGGEKMQNRRGFQADERQNRRFTALLKNSENGQ